MSPEPVIRAYKPIDRSAVFRIAANTAFFGEPVEAYLDDRRIFCDIFYRYYTDFESEHSWVASVGENVVGFVMGSVDTVRQQRVWREKILPSTLLGVLRGQYRLGRLTWRYLARLTRASLEGEFPRCDLDQYPAHLHINLERDWRGHGLGRRLMEAFLQHLRQLGIPGVHLQTTNINTAAIHLYTRMGFALLAERPTHIWEGIIEKGVLNRCYGLRLISN